MIATVSPGSQSSDHTLNTLRYADRIKEKKVGQQASDNARKGVREGNNPQRESPPQSFNNQVGYEGEYEEEEYGDRYEENRNPPPREGRRRNNEEKKKREKLSRKKLDERPRWVGTGEEDDEEEEDGRDPFGLRMEQEESGPPSSSNNLPDAPERHPPPSRLRKNSNPNIQYRGEEEEDQGPNGRQNRGGRRDDDLSYLQQSLEEQGKNTGDLATFHRTVENLFEEEEALINLHMSVIQENAELLTEEGRLLQKIQGENVVDYDIDAYAERLDQILERKMSLMTILQVRNSDTYFLSEIIVVL